jgi:formylglycine-generating enzyme required for sulfatase activity
MEQGFVNILKKLIAEQGKETLLNVSKCKAFLADYTKNEYKKESRLLLQALDVGVQRAIDTTEEPDICKKQQIRLLHEDYGLDERTAADIVDTLVLILRRDAVSTELLIEPADSINQQLEEKLKKTSRENAQLEKKLKKTRNGLMAAILLGVIGMVMMGIVRAQPSVTVPAETIAMQPVQPSPAPQPASRPERPVPDNFVRINGGTFTMGSPASEVGRGGDEGPQRQVTVSSFYIGRHEVTQKEYEEVMGTNPSRFKGNNLPVETVSWFDVIEYCNRRSQREGLTPAYTISGSGNNRTVTWNRNADSYRLPTEAEWEYACRAGTTTAYNTGAVINNNTGWYNVNSGGRTYPVGEKPANAWGLHDMHGNVFEWCWDWYGSYSNGAQTNPTGASSGSSRVLRGGSWSDSAEYVRSAYRVDGYPNYRFNSIGFRLARP